MSGSLDQTNTGAWQHFCDTAERIGATTKRLEKAAHLGRYFQTLGDDDLLHAARYFAGYTFSLRDQRTTNVGGAALLAAMEAASGVDPTVLRERLVVRGDAGDVAQEVFPPAPEGQAPLTLSHIAAALETLAATSGSKKKVELVTDLLRHRAPLEAKYLIKLLAGDLRIGLKEGAVEDGIARLASVKVEAIQWTNMLTGDIGETARLARHGQLEQARMHLFHPLKFMLATAAETLDDVAKQMPSGFIVEDKFDGIRAQAHIAPAGGEAQAPLTHGTLYEGRRVALFSRTLDEITGAFPDLVAPLAALISPGDSPDTGLILDGEIVPVQSVEGDHILPFQELQKRLGRKTLPDELLARVPVAFVAYDALYGPNRTLLSEPFATRRAVLEAHVPEAGAARRARSVRHSDISGLDDEFDAARARGNEGLMVKASESVYKPGRRGRDWLKIKRALATLDVVVTAAEVGTGRRSKFLSDYTFAVRASDTDPTLLNVGKAYSGLTDVEVQELSDWFTAHTLQTFAHGRVRIVEPHIVFEITFDRVQVSTRHKSGYALRFPRILRRRDDKPASEIDTLATVKRLAEELAGSGDDTDTP